MTLNKMKYYSRTDKAQVGQAGLQVEIRAKPTYPFYRHWRITTGDLCNYMYINGNWVGYSTTISCTSAITLTDDDYVTLQGITSTYWWQPNYRNFLMVGELEFS